jgi:hypothetical protein
MIPLPIGFNKIECKVLTGFIVGCIVFEGLKS